MALSNLTPPRIHRIYNTATDRSLSIFPYLLLLLHGAQPPRPPLFLGFRVLFYSDFCACPFENFPQFRSGFCWNGVISSEVLMLFLGNGFLGFWFWYPEVGNA